MAVGLYILILINWMIFKASEGISPSCQCIIYDKSYGKSHGVFTSPDYPTPYGTEIRCLLYTFIADPDQIVKISFDEFDIQVARPECIFGDYIKLYLHLDKPKVNEYTPWNKVLCGSIEDIDQIYYSAKNSLIFEFHSDWRNGNNTGFRGTYRFIKKKPYVSDGEKVPDTLCDYLFVSGNNTTRGRFFTPLYPSPFPKGSRCSYRFVGNANQRVRIIFEKVAFETSDSSCLNSPDQVKVRDGRGPEGSVILTICSPKTYVEARSTGSDLFIEFKSTSFFPKQGFKASYLFEESHKSLPSNISSTEPEWNKQRKIPLPSWKPLSTSASPGKCTL